MECSHWFWFCWVQCFSSRCVFWSFHGACSQKLRTWGWLVDQWIPSGRDYFPSGPTRSLRRSSRRAVLDWSSKKGAIPYRPLFYPSSNPQSSPKKTPWWLVFWGVLYFVLLGKTGIVLLLGTDLDSLDDLGYCCFCCRRMPRLRKKLWRPWLPAFERPPRPRWL